MSHRELEVSLAHNHLQIVDFDQLSHQPMCDPASGAVIVFNGQIYNFVELRHELIQLGERFTSLGDTEVLLRSFLRWGAGTLPKLVGMFAFAIWEPRKQKLTLARDRFGVKPCYYVNRADHFAFASTTAAFERLHSPAPNLDYLARGITHHLYELADGSSPFENVQSIPPGHYLELIDGRVTIHRYYDLAEAVRSETETIRNYAAEDIEDRFGDRLRSAVRVRTRLTMPVTVSLSGGLDSGYIAALLKEQGNICSDAFTFGGVDDASTEASLADLTARRLDLKLGFVTLPQEQIVETFEKTLLAQGAPFPHPAVMVQNRIFEAMRSAGYRVAFSGQGADEVLLGYRKFQLFHLLESCRQRQWRHIPNALLGFGKMLFGTLQDLGEIVDGRRYLKPGHQSPVLRRPHVLDVGIANYDSLQSRQMAEVGFASLATLLRYEDRNSMAHSLETRLPFLDHRVVETGLAMPTRLKLNDGYGKYILRRLAADRLPREIVHGRRKFAFRHDSTDIIRRLAPHLRHGIRPHLSALSDVFDTVTIGRLRNDRSYSAPANFPLLVAAYWLGPRL